MPARLNTLPANNLRERDCIELTKDLYEKHPTAPQPIRHPQTGGRAWWIVAKNPYWNFCAAIADQVVAENDRKLRQAPPRYHNQRE